MTTGSTAPEETDPLGSVATAVAPVFTVAARAARAAEYAVSSIERVQSDVADLKTIVMHSIQRQEIRDRQQEAMLRSLSADVADLSAEVMQATAQDASRDDAIKEARQRADAAREAAAAAQKRASAPPPRHRQSDAEIVERLNLATIKTIEQAQSLVIAGKADDMMIARMRRQANIRLYVAIVMGLLAAALAIAKGLKL